MVPTIGETQHRQMETNGYTIFEDVFTAAEMNDLDAVLEGFFNRHRQALLAGGDQGISRGDEIVFTHDLAEQDDRIRAFVTRDEFVALSTAFLGPDTDLYWNQTVYKLPEAQRLFPWHQDDGYTRVEPFPYLTLWLAIGDATEENGCISVLPGSHRRGFVEHRKSPIGLVCHDSDDPDQGITVPLKSGSIAAFWSLTMHKSGPNRSRGIRKAYVIQFIPVGMRVMETGEVIEGKIPIARGGVAA
jgi:ectoine hydroxylase-related dioxygenase (phytanoyl-CoA dioxygenase family)